MKYIIYPQQNDKLAVLAPAETTESSIKNIPVGTVYTIMDAPLSVDNDYFNGYLYNNGNIKPDISKCKEIHLDKFRAARTPLLEKLDLEYMRADEVGNIELKKELAAKKQALRDVTKTELPNTLEGIKNTWPEVLGKNPFNK